MPRTDNRLSNSDISKRIELEETDIRSANSETWAVRSDANDLRKWLKSAPLCDLLPQYHMLHLGVAAMPAPFRIVRTHLGGSYFLASLSGEGRVLVDGKWLASRPGQAFLLPPKTMHAFYTPEGMEWKFCWVRYQETKGQLPIARANSPVLARFSAIPLQMAIQGLQQECLGSQVPAMQDLWLRLIHGYVLQFAQPVGLDERVMQVWEQVAERLDYPWTITQLAKASHLSEKQFQRLCRRDLGRSPQQQLMWLRMRRAAELLTSGNPKVQVVAAAVGYQNPFVFSSTFKRILGWSPSEFPGSTASRR